MKGLTPRQRQVVTFIEHYVAQNAYAPSHREIMQHFGLKSVGSMHKLLQRLKQKGVLKSQTRTGRSLQIAEDVVPIIMPIKQEVQAKELELLLIGLITGGSPIELFAHPQKVYVPEHMVHHPEYTYVLRVAGDSLNDEWIADGDLLIVEARQEIHGGETVIGLINQHDTLVKRYYSEGMYIKLVGNNPNHKPLMVNVKDFQAHGVVIALLRLFY